MYDEDTHDDAAYEAVLEAVDEAKFWEPEGYKALEKTLEVAVITYHLGPVRHAVLALRQDAQDRAVIASRLWDYLYQLSPDCAEGEDDEDAEFADGVFNPVCDAVHGSDIDSEQQFERGAQAIALASRCHGAHLVSSRLMSEEHMAIDEAVVLTRLLNTTLGIYDTCPDCREVIIGATPFTDL